MVIHGTARNPQRRHSRLLKRGMPILGLCDPDPKISTCASVGRPCWSLLNEWRPCKGNNNRLESSRKPSSKMKKGWGGGGIAWLEVDQKQDEGFDLGIEGRYERKSLQVHFTSANINQKSELFKVKCDIWVERLRTCLRRYKVGVKPWL